MDNDAFEILTSRAESYDDAPRCVCCCERFSAERRPVDMHGYAAHDDCRTRTLKSEDR
jgi:hypothetical protein